MAPPKKLLYLHNSPIRSEAANLVQVVSMCSAFSDAGYETVLVLYEDQPEMEGAGQLLAERFGCSEKVKLRLVRRNLPLKIYKHINHLWMKRVVRDERPDLCFVRDPKYFRMALSMNVPVILELHNARLHIGSGILNRLFGRMVIRGSGNPLCLQVIAVSAALAGYWEDRGIPAGKITPLHDGFSESMFTGLPAKEEARLRLGLPADDKIVLYTGNLQPNRGIHYILDLAEAFPQLTFLLVGGSSRHIDHFREVCHHRGLANMLFAGHQPHRMIPWYLQAADILLAMWSKEVPTIRYCSPLKVFEYQAAGKPIFFPGYPTILEVAEEGNDAFIARPDDPVSFRETLQRMLDADPGELAVVAGNAREKALSRFTWKHRAEAVIETLPAALRP